MYRMLGANGIYNREGRNLCIWGDRRVQNAPRVLYISYDGALEPLGQSQILPYLRGLASLGASITLISFEKRADIEDMSRVQTLQAELSAQGVRWISMIYHKRPTLLATSFDLLFCMIRAVVLVRRDQVQVIHARSYVPALVAWILKRLLGVRFIFDMRGFWADERVDGGLWPPGGFLYRLAKRLENRLLKDADEVVTLTERARLTVEQWPGIKAPRVTVIPTCVDLERFTLPASSGPPNSSPVFIYTGSLGTWYLLREMLDFIGEVLKRFPYARFQVLTRNRREATNELMKSKLTSDTVMITSVFYKEILRWLTGAHAGLAFYKSGWARQATCPTKVGEYLAMGLPVVVNDEVGVVEEVIGAKGVGVILSEFSTEAYTRALDQLQDLWADPILVSRCRRVAESYFSLQLGG